MVEPIAFGP